MTPPDDKRQVERQPVLKVARVQFGISAIDCLVLDQSPTGLRVSFDTEIQIPSTMNIVTNPGAIWVATRRWQRGQEAGLELVSFLGLNVTARENAVEFAREVELARPSRLLAAIASAQHFGDVELEEAVVETGRAFEALLTRLRYLADVSRP